MKKIFITITILCFSLTAIYAQSETQAFDVDGIKVILKPTIKQIISVRIYYRGGVANYPAVQAGIESFALQATTECGTAKYNANDYRDLADKYGIELGSEAETDYGDIQMGCVAKYFKEGWELFAEAVKNPVFDVSEVQLLRNKMLANIRQVQSDPDKHSDQLIVKNAFEGTPYATDPDGDESVVQALTAADLKNYYTSILNKNQIFIVVAGKISKEELTEKIKASFGDLPSRPYRAVTYSEPAWGDNKVLVEKRELSTNYINAIMNAPPVNSTDFVPFRLGIAAFGGALFGELRTRLNLSYNPGTSIVMQQMPYALMFVSTTSPKEAVEAMTKQLNRVRDYGLTKGGLGHLKSSFITNNYIKQQSSSAITGTLGVAEVLGGWQLADSLPALVGQVTVDQINMVMNKYIVGLRWSYLGDGKLADDAAEAFKIRVR